LRAVLTVCHESNNLPLSPDGGRRASLGLDTIKERIIRLKEAKISTVILSGGEPTIRPDIFTIADAVRNSGLMLGLITNGRMFCYSNFADTYAEYMPEYTQITVYSHEKKIHDGLAGVTGAFEQTLAGIRNIAGKLENVTVCIPVNGYNARDIKEVPDLVWGLGLKARFKFTVSGLEGIHGVHVAKAALSIESAVDCVSDAISYGMEKYSRHEMTFCWEGFAPCQISDFPSYGTDPLSEDIALVWDSTEESFKDTYVQTNHGEITEECLICSRCSSCFAEQRGFINGFIEHTPNAVGYNYNRTLNPTAEPLCPAGSALCAGLHPLHDVAVMSDGMIDIYQSDRQSNSHAMNDVKFSREQVYLNISGRARNLDFRTAFRRLVLHEKCRECVRHRTRTGVFAPLEGNAFARVEEEEMAWLKKIKGRVLDIGCGRPLFPEILAEKIIAGEIEYLGVDRYPECPDVMKTVAVDFEDFSWDGRSFDHIMMLRSYNHFIDPRSVLRKAAGLLNAGGQLHIFENGLFAMLKKNVVDHPSDSDLPSHQHYRNHYSEDVLKLLAFADNFEVVRHTSVTPESANQWFLTLRAKTQHARSG
jgi:2-polyprenyl-3-methyl-5-hydroxy-6-metoxy-1,4-benzoquinol methylase